jgi:cell wall-associated NlpC family hydrolase
VKPSALRVTTPARVLGAALWLAAASALVACGSAPPQPNPGAWADLPPDLRPSAPLLSESSPATPVPGHLTPEQAVDVTVYALGLVGTPYRYGGNTPESGFDCSGLVQHVYQTRAHITPPRTTAELTFWGLSVPREQLRSGDLVLFGRGSLANHAGIYVGQGRFVHAPSTGGTVRMDLLDARHWQGQQPRFRRP